MNGAGKPDGHELTNETVSHPHAKVNSTWIQDLNARPEIIKPEGNAGGELLIISFGDDVFRI